VAQIETRREPFICRQRGVEGGGKDGTEAPLSLHSNGKFTGLKKKLICKETKESSEKVVLTGAPRCRHADDPTNVGRGNERGQKAGKKDMRTTEISVQSRLELRSGQL